MQLKEFLFDEDRGVSPVIGVILMVAITVILAAVIATFVMNMGPSDTGPENAQLKLVDNDDHVLITHDGGDSFSINEYVIEVDENTGSGTTTNEYQFDGTNGYSSDYTMTAGDEFALYGSSTTGSVSNYAQMSDASNSSEVEEVRIIWESPDSDRTEIVREWSP